MYRLCFGTIMTILYQARSHKVTNKSICNALFSCFGKWMFLEKGDGEIIESKKYPSITLVDFHQAYYKTNYVTRKENEPDEWRNLKKQISAMLNELEKINQIIRE